MTQYGTIMMDPPWREIGGGKIKRGADRHYPVMTSQAISDLLVDVLTGHIADDAHCYLWVTNNRLPQGLSILNIIGFRYVTNIVWVKDGIGLGQYFRGKHEICLFGVRGSAMVPPPEDRFPSVIQAPRRAHSEKPGQIFDIAEVISPEPRIELFARERRFGWDSWGNEV